LTIILTWSYVVDVTTSARVQGVQSRKARAEHILDAAADLLIRWGYKRITIDDVARQAGIGKGTVYLHWKTREELFYSVIMREQLSAVEEQLSALHRDPWEVQLHRLIRWKYLTTMRRPILKAVFMADPEIVGKLAHESSGADLVRLQGTISSDYLQVLIEHGLARADMSTGDLLYQMGATAIGFFTSDSFLSAFGWNPEFERKADLLEDAIERCFSLPASEEACRAALPRVIELFQRSRELCIAYLSRAYAARPLQTGEEP
jgi:AcrR family transcriptional regulator